MPPRAVDSTQSKKKNAIRSRSGRRVAPRRSPFLSRNYEIASLKDPLRASARSILSIFFSLIGVVTHRRPPLSRSSYRRRLPSLALFFPSASSATHYPILPPDDRPLLSSSLSLSLFCLPSSYSPRVFIPDRFVLLPVATPRDRPRLAQVTAIGNFNARPVLPNDFIQRNGCRGAVRSGVHDRCPNSGIDTAHSFTFASSALLLSPTRTTRCALVCQDLTFSVENYIFAILNLLLKIFICNLISSFAIF